MTTAQTILAQLGGNKFLAMTGAKNLVGGSETLSFAIPASRRTMLRSRSIATTLIG